MKKFLIRLVVLLVIVSLGQTLLLWVSPDWYWEHSPVEIKNFHEAIKKPIDVLYFGDSILNSTYSKELDKTLIGTYLSEYFPSMRIITFNHPAYDVSIYQEYIKLLVSKSIKPKVVVIPINLRMFSPKWYLRPDWQFEREIWTLKSVITWPLSLTVRPLEAFKFFEWKKISAEKYNNSPVYFKSQNVGKVVDFKEMLVGEDIEIQTKRLFQVIYLTDLSSDNSKIIALKNTAQLLKQNGIKAIFYVTPVDYRSGEIYWGPDFNNITDKKISLLRNVLQAEGQNLFDWSKLLASENFYWRMEKTLNEHLLSSGRQILAANVAAEIKSAINLNNVSE